MKRKILLLILLCVTFSFVTVAQRSNNDDRKARFEKFQKERIEAISKVMNLTGEEAKLFWSLNNELQTKKFETNKELREEMSKLHKAEREKKKLSEAEYLKIIKLSLEVKLKEAELEKEYYTKFLQIISAEKLLLYQKAEQDFGRQVMERRGRDNNQRR